MGEPVMAAFSEPFPLNGGRAGLGVYPCSIRRNPDGARPGLPRSTDPAPPSPTLPPSRGKGALPKSHAGQRAGRVRLVKGRPCGPVAPRREAPLSNLTRPARISS